MYGQPNYFGNQQYQMVAMNGASSGSNYSNLYGLVNMDILNMGGLGNPAQGGTHFFFMGSCIQLQSRLEGVRNQMTPIHDASITVNGAQIKEMNMSCYLLTVITGSIIILPLIFMCMNWWQKIVFPAFDIPLSTYQKLDVLFLNPSIRSVSMAVNDNLFDQAKAKVLYDMLSRSTVKGFTFVNSAIGLDYNNNQYSNFKQNMKGIKMLPIMTDMKWYNQLVL